MARASLYSYPENKQPEISVKKACEIAESILAKLGHGQEYFAYEVSILGDEDQTGAGTWTLRYRNTKGDKIQFGIFFPEDRCHVTEILKDGNYTEKEYTRDGLVSPKWMEWRKKNEEDEKPFDPSEPGEKTQKAEPSSTPDGDKPSN